MSTAPSCTTCRRASPSGCSEMINLWYAEAGRATALPARRPGPVEIIDTPRPQLAAATEPLRLLPRTSPRCPSPQAVNIRNRSYGIGALVDIPAPGAEGVLFAHGSRFGGHALYIKDNRLHYVYNWVGSFEQKIVATEDVPVGENLILAANFEKDGEDPPGVATGILSLYHGDTKVGEGRIKTQPGQVRARRRGAVRRTRQRRGGHRRLPGTNSAHVHRRHDQPRRRRRQRRAVPRPRARGRGDARARVGTGAYLAAPDGAVR